MKHYSKPKYEVADIFNKHGQAYRENSKLPLAHHKVMNAIQACRTSALGGHKDGCSECGFDRLSYNSCRNRHCPKCQGMNQLKWVDKSVANLLPTGYFHLVFTIPSELNRLSLVNKRVLYSILFKAASETITMLCKDKKYLGATPGITSVLHTWGQNLSEHPHVHVIVTAGGLSNSDNRWVNSKKKFFIPVKVLSKVFRGKFLSKLKEAFLQKELRFHGSTVELGTKTGFQRLRDILYAKSWVVYAKKPFGSGAQVLKYLGKYTHRIAISNHRIVSVGEKMVCFKWKDHRDNNNQKVMELGASEFIRRFLLHVLPKGFCKIRYYGMTANRNKAGNLKSVRQLLKAPTPMLVIDKTWQELLERLTGFNVSGCPKCKKGEMKTIIVLQKQGFG